MNKEEILEYNKRCAEFLGKIKKGHEFSLNPIYEFNKKLNSPDDTWATTAYSVDYMKFHLDWNWIMEVVNAIEKLGYQFDITGNEVGVNSNIMSMENIPTGGTMNSYNRSYYPTIISICEEDYSKKEAVVEAINSFLKFYNKNKE